MKKIIAYCNPSASRIYRIEQIAKYLNRTGRYQMVISPTEVKDEQLLWADIVVVQGLIDPKMIADIWAYKIERKRKVIVDRDDMFSVTQDNPLKENIDKVHGESWSKELIKIADVVTVTNKAIAKECKPLNENSIVLPNYLDMEVWDRPTVQNQSDVIRIGWMGSITHRADLEMILPALKHILNTYNVKFVFCGDNLSSYFKDLPRMKYEYIPGTANFYHWPLLAHTLQFDIGVAPLVDNHFNSGRSQLKYLEYGITKVPAVYSPHYTAVKHGDTGYIAHTTEDWVTYLENLIKFKALRRDIAKRAYYNVRKYYDIKQHIKSWDALYSQV